MKLHPILTLLLMLILMTYRYHNFPSTISALLHYQSCSIEESGDLNFWYFMMVRCGRQLDGRLDYYCSTINSCHWEYQLQTHQHPENFTFDLQHAEKLLMDNIERITISPFLLFPSDQSLNENVHSEFTMFRDFQRIGKRSEIDRSVVQGVAKRVEDEQLVFLKITPRAEAWTDRQCDQDMAHAYDMEMFDWGPFVILVRTSMKTKVVNI